MGALAARPATLTAALTPVMVGSAVAQATGGARPGPALAALFGAFMLQITSNLANYVFDHEKGADTHERLGPTRAVQAGLLTPREVRAGLLAAVALAFVAGRLPHGGRGGWPVVVIGVLSVLSGVAYTGGPYPLGYHGLGDVFVLVFFGFVAVCGTVFVQTGAVPMLAWLAAAPVGAIATAVLVVNNVRDRAMTDVTAGQAHARGPLRQAARRRRRVRRAPRARVRRARPSPVLALHPRAPWALLPLATLLPRARPLPQARDARGPVASNDCLAGTAKLLLLHGALFAAGIALGR